jgi:hypothetical protein
MPAFMACPPLSLLTTNCPRRVLGLQFEIKFAIAWHFSRLGLSTRPGIAWHNVTPHGADVHKLQTDSTPALPRASHRRITTEHWMKTLASSDAA